MKTTKTYAMAATLAVLTCFALSAFDALSAPPPPPAPPPVRTALQDLGEKISSLLKASGIDATSKNLESFRQILKKNVTASIEDRGNLVDQLV